MTALFAAQQTGGSEFGQSGGAGRVGRFFQPHFQSCWSGRMSKLENTQPHGQQSISFR